MYILPTTLGGFSPLPNPPSVSPENHQRPSHPPSHHLAPSPSTLFTVQEHWKIRVICVGWELIRPLNDHHRIHFSFCRGQAHQKDRQVGNAMLWHRPHILLWCTSPCQEYHWRRRDGVHLSIDAGMYENSYYNGSEPGFLSNTACGLIFVKLRERKESKIIM